MLYCDNNNYFFCCLIYYQKQLIQLKEKRVSHDINEILGLWETDKPKAVQKVTKVLRRIEYNKADESWHEANDYFIFNELFLTEQISKQCRKLLDVLYEYLIYLDPIYENTYDRESIEKQRLLRETEIPSEREKLTSIMKSELTMSFTE